tara:strand:- start:198 stop:503 length:306 start_codon:yes stop_codon:yes gene_type:complete
MSESSNDSDYDPNEIESDSDIDACATSGYSEITKSQEAQLRKLQEIGELKTENIIEIQYLEQLIKDSTMDSQQKLQTGKCLEMLINCSNAYINSFADRKHK